MLSAELSEKLKNLAQISDEDFLLVLSIAKGLIVASATAASAAGDSLPGPELNSCLTTVLALVAESVRQDQDLREYLTEQRFPAAKTDLLLKLLDNVRNATLVSLKSVQNHLPKVVDANWSLNYTEKDSSSERVGGLEYQLELNTVDTEGKEKPVHFVCDVNEMQDLVGQLKQVCKHLERTSSN